VSSAKSAAPGQIADVPQGLRRAILAGRQRFYEHGGVDYIGVLRAMLHNSPAVAPNRVLPLSR
jgi:membrane carboxypeptidase/penicillin-binding protein